MFARRALRVTSLQFSRGYVVKEQTKKLNNLVHRIGDEKTAASQNTIKVVRMIGAGSIIVVLCSLFWASSMSAPVKETYIEPVDLSKDVRES